MWTIIVKAVGTWLKEKEGGWFCYPGWFKSGWFERDLYRSTSWTKQKEIHDHNWTIVTH